MVPAPNCLMLAEIGFPLGEMYSLHHQGRREIWLAEPRRLSLRRKSLEFSARFHGVNPKTQIFSHCHHNL